MPTAPVRPRPTSTGSPSATASVSGQLAGVFVALAPGTVTTTTAYDADDEATLATDPDGNATLTCYDGDGNVAQTVPPVGVAANSLTASSCPTSYPTDYGDRLATDATTTAYNALGNKTTVTTPAPAGLIGLRDHDLRLRRRPGISPRSPPRRRATAAAQPTT